VVRVALDPRENNVALNPALIDDEAPAHERDAH
jgi:hypothetical protein